MTYTVQHSLVRKIRAGEPDFNIVDGLLVHPRASLEVTPGAPANIATTLDWAIAQGYIRCVAHVKDYELMWDKLSEH
jgi:hypothetical protein